MSDVLRCFLRALLADQRRRAKRDLGIRQGLCGSVTFIQRFGSALNRTPHVHALVLDGVYAGPRHAPGRFRELDSPETDDVARVLAGTARRIRRLLASSGLEKAEDPLREDDPLMALLGAASIRSRIATGPEAGSPWRRLGDRVEPVDEAEGADGIEPRAAIPPRCVREGSPGRPGTGTRDASRGVARDRNLQDGRVRHSTPCTTRGGETTSRGDRPRGSRLDYLVRAL